MSMKVTMAFLLCVLVFPMIEGRRVKIRPHFGIVPFATISDQARQEKESVENAVENASVITKSRKSVTRVTRGRETAALMESMFEDELFFPITLACAGTVAIFDKPNFDGPKVFEFVKKAANRPALENICFLAKDGAKKHVSNTKKGVMRLFVYSVVNGKKMELITCDD